ncbi:MAG: MerR family transcriptional regulator [Acidobacteria bacterium]|nr:MerR family transcriptional regulator [Acidobacteriota bacterium]
MTHAMLTIGALAAQAGVNVETIRFYQRKGIVPVPPRPERGVRRYSKDHVDRVRFIKAAQLWGFTLGEVADLLRLQDGMACDATRRIAEERLAVVTARMRELRNVAGALRRAIAECRTRRGRVSCPLITSVRRSGLARGRSR